MGINRKGMTLLTKSLFAIFMVLFVFFVFFMVVGGKISKLQDEEQFSAYDRVNKVMLTVLSNPNCLSVGNQLSSETSSTIQGVLDIHKLDNLNNENQDLWCVENFDFIYNLEIEDEAYNRWQIGPVDIHPDGYDRKVQITLPVVVKFDNGIVHSAKASLNAYTGNIPRFLGAIKETCVLHQPRTYSLNTDLIVGYYESNNTFYIGESHYFFPYFSCKVGNFSVPKGKNLIYINYNNGRVGVEI